MSGGWLKLTGALGDLSTDDRAFLCVRSTSRDAVVRDRTAQIISRVRSEGDPALRALAAELDGARLDSLEVPRDLWRRALAELQPALRRALERAAANIERAHRAFLPRPIEVEMETSPALPFLVLMSRSRDSMARTSA